MENIMERVDAFKAMGDPTRFKILQHLSRNDKLCVTALARRLGASQPTVSQHLKILKTAKLVLARRTGNHILYQIEPAVFNSLIAQLQLFLGPPVEKCTDEVCEAKSC